MEIQNRQDSRGRSAHESVARDALAPGEGGRLSCAAASQHSRARLARERHRGVDPFETDDDGDAPRGLPVGRSRRGYRTRHHRVEREGVTSMEKRVLLRIADCLNNDAWKEACKSGLPAVTPIAFASIR